MKARLRKRVAVAANTGISSKGSQKESALSRKEDTFVLEGESEKSREYKLFGRLFRRSDPEVRLKSCGTQ